ncbi:RxLR effector protein [Phytophthora megakarya]|uniref:RxLR effector protein n=1 Tax=Phytophthora megakarya TaxID=4795 RepID=A0A225UER9_9STRA|nr:RxLR effector protein [Phytophthora megakarya]
MRLLVLVLLALLIVCSSADAVPGTNNRIATSQSTMSGITKTITNDKRQLRNVSGDEAPNEERGTPLQLRIFYAGWAHVQGLG